MNDDIGTDSSSLAKEVNDWRKARTIKEFIVRLPEFAARLYHAIESLRPEYRLIFILAEVDGRSLEEIASITDLTVPALKSRRHRARNMVRQKLAPYYPVLAEIDDLSYEEIAR